MIELLIEALVVGLLLVIVGYLVTIGINKLFNRNLSDSFINLKKNKTLLIIFFLSGSLTHLLFEFLGGNKWYCKNGFACKSN